MLMPKICELVWKNVTACYFMSFFDLSQVNGVHILTCLIISREGTELTNLFPFCMRICSLVNSLAVVPQ